MSEVVIYKSESGAVEVRLDGDTVWLSQDQMSELFGKAKSTINEHIKNVFEEGELDQTEVMKKFGNSEFAKKPTNFYNLDTIISVGYRVKSVEGTRFRQWATKVLREHLTKGYTLNQHRFESNAQELQAALNLVRKVAANPEVSGPGARGLADIVSRYAQTFLLLQRYDEGLLTSPKVQDGGTLPTVDEAKSALSLLKSDLVSKGEATDLFAREREDGLASLLGNLDQSVFGEPAYPSIESKAAHLIYFVIKNHPFSDGNKRSGAFLFVDFLNRNNRLIGPNGEPVINDIGLAALALLIAESEPSQKEPMINLVMNMLSGGGQS